MHLTPDANGVVPWDVIELGGAGRKSPLPPHTPDILRSTFGNIRGEPDQSFVFSGIESHLTASLNIQAVHMLYPKQIKSVLYHLLRFPYSDTPCCTLHIG